MDHLVSGNRILNAKEVCERLGIGKNTLYEWCDQRLIPHKRVGGTIDQVTGEHRRGRILFSERCIQEWVENSGNDNHRE